MKLIDVVNFNTFYEAVKDKPLPFKTSYKLAKIAKAVETETDFYRTKLRETIMEFALLDDSGNPMPTPDGDGIKLRPDSEQACGQKLLELQEMEIDFPAIALTIEEFENIDLTVDQIRAALPLFE